MARERKERGFVGRLIRPARPRIVTDTGLGVRQEARMLLRALKSGGRLCPNDNTQMTLEDVFQMDSDGQPTGDPYRAFVCPTCDASEPVRNVVQEAQGQLTSIRKSERDYFLFGFVVIILFGFIAFRTGNIWTAVGGMMLGLSLLVVSVFHRYRRWQVLNEKMFMATPPWRDWIRDEFDND